MTQQLKISPIRALADNYIWMIRRPGAGVAAVVDPGDARPVLAGCEREGIAVAAVLITHHHRDHMGGIAGLLTAFPDIPVYGPAREAIPGLTHRLGEGAVVDLAAVGARFEVMEVPGHTAGHIAYFGGGRLFCGDTLFGAGCGRVFDGTVEALAASTARIARLPPATQIYCAHEYTVDNLGFARWVEPDNPAILERDAVEMARVERGEPTVPSRLELELQTNPFLRTAVPAVIAAAEKQAGRRLGSAAEVFAVLRHWKDTEYD